MRENREIVPVFFTTDEKYAPYLSVALTSLIANTDPTSDTSYRVIVVHKDLSQQAQEIFRAMSTDKVAVELYPMRDYMIQSINSDHNKLRADYETLTIYFRLFLSEMFPDIDKAIYLDADTVTNVDIAQLYRIDLGDNFVAAVNDNFVAAGEETSYYTLNALGIPSSEYVNSGVLLMNLKAMREAGFVDHFVKLLNAYHVESIAADQDYLNVMCRGRILMLGYEWNTMMADGTSGPEHPKIIHYNLFGKPWNYRDATNADYFWRYAEGSAYYSQLVEGVENFTETDANSDARKKAKLIAGALRVPKNEVTFRKLEEEGVRVRLAG